MTAFFNCSNKPSDLNVISNNMKTQVLFAFQQYRKRMFSKASDSLFRCVS